MSKEIEYIKPRTTKFSSVKTSNSFILSRTYSRKSYKCPHPIKAKNKDNIPPPKSFQNELSETNFCHWGT